MNITWLLEKDLWEEENNEMRQAIKSLGYNYRDVEYIPFSDQDFSNIQNPDELCIFYGSLQLAKKLRPHAYGVYCNLPEFRCSNYYNYFGEYLLNKRYIMLPFGELKRRIYDVFRLFYPHQSFTTNNYGLFIRPDGGDKLFTGQVITYNNFEKDFDLLNFYDVDKNSIVTLSLPKKIDREWRVVVVDKEVVAASKYRENNKLIQGNGSCPVEVAEYVTKLASIWEPEPVWCADVCESNGNLFLLEINSFSCSGLYGCNKHSIVDKVSKLTLKNKELYV